MNLATIPRHVASRAIPPVFTHHDPPENPADTAVIKISLLPFHHHLWDIIFHT